MDMLYFLDQQRGAILSCNTDGRNIRTVLADCPRHPDGIAIDAEAGHIYWTNMGADFKRNDGSIERCNLDGTDRRTIVAEGLTFTPKQVLTSAGYLYWCDREGMRVMRSALDGSNMEILVQTGVGEDDMRDARNWCVGIAINDGMVYWTQKGPPAGGAGRILRAPLQQPSAALPKVLPAARTDIEVVFDNLPEPVDLEFGPEGALYWTDRAKTPDGGAVNRTSGRNVPGHHLLASDLGEAIGLAIDHRTGRIFVSTLQGDVYSLNLDGGDRREIVSGAGRLTGICYHRGHE